MMRWLLRWSVVLALPFALTGAAGGLRAAETSSEMKTTQIILALDTVETVPIRMRTEQDPPAVILDFPGQQVSGSLPERAIVHHGVIGEIQTRYRIPEGRNSPRMIDSLRIGLTGPYTPRVQAKPGFVVIEIDHPATVQGNTVEIGLGGGTILSGLARDAISERFRAMQEALSSATPVPWTFRASGMVGASSASAPASTAAAPLAVSEDQAPSPWAAPAAGSTSRSGFWVFIAWLAILAGCAVAAPWLGHWHHSSRNAAGAHERRPSLSPSGAMLVDQLVCRAFERQGYQLVRTTDLSRPPGQLRVLTKDSVKLGLLCVLNGVLFEKSTVEDFMAALAVNALQHGFLVGSGSFTVPAQRRAKDAGITLIGREELVELLSAGAMSEYFSKQLEGLHARLDESIATVDKYATELESLRRQRNEATWFLGEQRAKHASLETEAEELSRQLQQQQAEAVRWQTEVTNLHKRWEESQWYLGEANARLQYLETQIAQLQEIARSAESAQRERDESKWYLGEERSQREQLAMQLQALGEELKQYLSRERALRDQIVALKTELDSLRTYGERRASWRSRVPEAIAELRDDADQVVFSGSPRDLGGGGMGFESGQELTQDQWLRVSLQCPGQSEPVRSRARVVWQRADHAAPARYGCQFSELSAADSDVIERAVHPAT